MGKKKKTLKQKKLAELRLKEPHGKIVPSEDIQDSSIPTPATTFSFSFTKGTKHVTTQPHSLSRDLQKTIAVSTSILLFVVLLSVLLHNHAFVLPLVSLRY